MIKLKSIFIVGFFCLLTVTVNAQQPMETEEAILIPAKTLAISATYEYQTSADGKESALPFAFAYGITDRLEIAVEPVPYTHINPSSGKGAKGLGDIEATVTYTFSKEQKFIPALAFAGEVKFPTAKNNLIGTGKTDYTIYLIATKNTGKFEHHLNIGYAIVGKPAGMDLNNIFNFAAASEFHLNNRVDFLAEVLANTTSQPEMTTTGIENSTSPEISGGEVVGMVGMRLFFNKNFFVALGVTYDNNNALLFRPGLTYFFR